MMILGFVLTAAIVTVAGVAICTSDESDKAARVLADANAFYCDR